MGLSCGLTCLKYTLFALNFVAWVIGAIIFGVAIWILTDDSLTGFVDTINLEYYYTGAYLILTAGILILIIGFVGCCGAFRENICMLSTYFVCLAVIFLVEMAAAIYVLIVGIPYTSLDDYVKKNMYVMINNYNNDKVRWVMDDMQSDLHCCGVMSSYDYDSINLPVPDSCRDPVTGNQYSDDCYDAFINYIAGKSGLIAGLGITSAILHVVAMVMAACMCQGLRKEYKDPA